ncbi:hypothetical protein [Nakamurella panacisegetis]|uniref:hypothetical protein n=1 Tax=Nakamurella panacisegetis TaxID=1090615 RepID=UPI0012FDA261|nr:hypothetical protein [Nakamurella panacisegetis]
MDRRAAGVMVLFVALLCAMVVPSLVGKRVAGSAVSEVIAAPPTVGSCVTAITGPDRPPRATRPNAAVTALPVATVAPSCTGTVIGEIISVQPTSSSTVTTLDEFVQANPSCRSQVEKYLGTTATSTIDGMEWTKSIHVDAVTVGPNAHDRAAGRTWTACVLSTVGQTYNATTSLKSSWDSGTLPDEFGLCWDRSVVPRGTPTSCTSPHSTQQLGYGFVASPTDSGTSIVSGMDADGMTAGCRTLAASVMKTSDPTKGGRLAVKVVAQAAGAPYVQCVVTVVGSGKLTGSVIGIGSKALPLR